MHTSIHSARTYIFYTSILFALFSSNVSAQTQCLESNDADMAKYMNLTKTGDAQACSPCAQLALYLCGATHCFKMEDKRKTSAIINDMKKVVRNMGLPGCCPKLLERPIIWGDGSQSIQEGNITDNGTSNNANNTTILEGNSNPLQVNTNSYSTGDADVDKLLNAATDLTNQLSGESSTGSSYGSSNPYSTGDADVDNLVNASMDLANQLNGGTSPATSYSTTPSYSTGDADVDNLVTATTDLVNVLGGETSYGGGDLGDAFGILGTAMNEVNEQDRINEQAAALKRKQDAAIRANAYAKVQEGKQQMADGRKALIEKYPDGKMPLSFPEISETEIYFFAYKSFDPNINPVPVLVPESIFASSLSISDLKKGQYYLIEANPQKFKYYFCFTKRTGDVLLGPFRVFGDPTNKWYNWGGFTTAKILKEVTEQEAKGTDQTANQGALSFSSLLSTGNNSPASNNTTIPLTDLIMGKYYLIQAYAGKHKYYASFKKRTGDVLIGDWSVAAAPQKIWYKDAQFTEVSIIKEVTEQEAKGTAQANISISNVFSVSKFSDGTWPLKSKVLEKLNLSGDAANGIILCGYYTNRNQAESNQQYLLAKARELAFTVSTITCTNTESTKAITPATDNLGKSANSGSKVVEPASTRPKLDFWDNPIKD